MREILFRGKCVDSGEWVEGWLMNERIIPKGQEFTVECRNPQYFVDTDKLELYEITPSTICQYTGLTDKNGTRIFEGDIARVFDGEYINGVVGYSLEYGAFTIDNTSLLYLLPDVKIIGNVYDNPELLEEK